MTRRVTSLWKLNNSVVGSTTTPIVIQTGVQALPIKEETGTTYTITLDDYNVVMTNVAARTVTLYTSPPDGFMTVVTDGANNASTVLLTVVTGGTNTFADGSTSYRVDGDSAATEFQFDSATGKYWIK